MDFNKFIERAQALGYAAIHDATTGEGTAAYKEYKGRNGRYSTMEFRRGEVRRYVGKGAILDNTKPPKSSWTDPILGLVAKNVANDYADADLAEIRQLQDLLLQVTAATPVPNVPGFDLGALQVGQSAPVWF